MAKFMLQTCTADIPRYRSTRRNIPGNLPSEGVPLPLWSDDFRPANVIVDEEDNLLGSSDWEYSYAGPAQFVFDPPWWLLLDVPEMWDDDIDDWISIYTDGCRPGRGQRPPVLPLSAYMREIWAMGRVWLNYAARKSWAVDIIYWKYLDEKFFGKRDENIPLDEL
ncbi:hypothetical protein PspLS_08045 [Pyricularia sp. CBS 133598]|nr:hypothetical protein PspLS_08045 [Pyricularia sp. CBS 133598]